MNRGFFLMGISLILIEAIGGLGFVATQLDWSWFNDIVGILFYITAALLILIINIFAVWLIYQGVNDGE